MWFELYLKFSKIYENSKNNNTNFFNTILDNLNIQIFKMLCEGKTQNTKWNLLILISI